MVFHKVYDYIRDSDFREIFSVLRGLGLRGTINSVRLSLSHTDRPLAIVHSSNTRTDFRSGAEVNIGSLFAFGFMIDRQSSYWLGGSKISLGPEAKISVSDEQGITRIGPGSILNVDGIFEMGGSSYIHSHAHITAHDRISIGNDCAIARGFSVRDADVHDLEVAGKIVNDSEPVEIQDSVWIGSNVSVKKGVTIGEGSVIASDSVVTRDIPSNVLAAGVPAEVIEDDVSWAP